MIRGFHFGLASRLVLAFVALSGALMLAYSWLALRMAERTLKNELGGKLITVARLASADEKIKALPFAMRAEGGQIAASARARLGELAETAGVANIMVTDNQDRVLVDAMGRYKWRDAGWLLRLDRAELKKVWRGTASASQVYQGEDGGLYLSAYAPVKSQGQVLAVVGAEASAAFLENVRRMRTRFANVGLALLALAAALGWLSAQTVTRPLRNLREAVERVGKGDFTATAKVREGHEVGELARAFNRMAQAINVRHEEILENMSNGLVAVDRDGNVAEINRAAEALLGVKRDSVLGRSHRESLPDELARALDETLAGDEPRHGEKVTMARGDEQVILQISTSVLRRPDEAIQGAEAMFLDVTETERLTNALETHKRFAAIGEVAAEVAHQIRNPLGAIHGFADLIKSELKDAGKPKEFLADLTKEVRAMEEIVSNFLQYARPSRLEVAEVDVREPVQAVCRAMQPEFDKAGIKLKLKIAEDLPAIKADSKVIQQAFGNLLRNALEACSAGGEVSVEAEREEPGGGVRIAVSDDGAGLAPEIEPRLFAPFVTTKAKGTGLGLSLAKKFIEAHGGRISLKPLAKGVQAQISLPAAATMAEV